MINVFTLPTVAAMLVFWVLGLYVLTRSPRNVSSCLAALGQFLIALYLLGHALASNASTPHEYRLWGQGFWFGAAASPATWYWLTVSLAERQAVPSRPARAVGIILGVLAALALVAGYADDLLFHWSAPEVHQTPLGFRYYGVRATSLYAIYVVATLGSLAAGCLVLARTRLVAPTGSLRRAQASWVLASGLLFSAGAAYLIVGVWLQLSLPAQPGHAILAVGVAMVGFGVARYNALVEGQVIGTDFVYFSASSFALAVFYGAIVVAFVGLTATALPLLLAVVLAALATHALSDTAHGIWDRLFYRGDVRLLRGELRALESEVARAPARVDVIGDAQRALERVSEAHFRAVVEDALRKLNNLAALAEHPLHDAIPSLIATCLPVAIGSSSGDAPAVAGATSLDRARALRLLLVNAIVRLRPGPEGTPAPEHPSQMTASWAHYLILHEAYDLGRPNKQIMRRYQLSEGTFNRARRQAIDLLASELQERASALGD